VIGLGVHTNETGATGSKSRTGRHGSQNEEKIMAKPLDKFVTRGDFLRADEESRKVRFRASTPTIDRHGTIVRPEGISVKNFKKNPIFLWGHDGYGSMFGGGPEMENVIGKVTDYERSKEAFDIDVEFAPAEVNPKADLAYKLTKSGFLNTVSVGFSPIETSVEKVARADSDEKVDVLVYDRSELLEVSLVPIPSNPEALALVRSMAQEVNDTTPPWVPYLSSSSNLTDDGTYEIIINFGSELDPHSSPEDSADLDVAREIRREIQKWLLRQSLRS
jgi:HK97 family phage prohead protease